MIPVISLNGPVFPTENETNIITPYLSTSWIIPSPIQSVNSYLIFSYFFTIFSFTIAYFNKNQIKYMYLTRIMSLIPVTSFSCQEITKGLSNSPSAIIYKLFHDAQSLLQNSGHYLPL